MIQKISFGDLPQVNNLPQKQNNLTDVSSSENKENTGISKNTMLGLAALGALALGGIYYAATRGRNSSELTKAASERLNNAADNPIVDKEIPKMKMNEDAQKFYDELQEYFNGKLNLEINDKKSKTLEKMASHYEKEEEIAAEKFFTGTRTRTDKEKLEIITETYEKGIKIKESSGFYDKAYGEVNKVTTFDPDNKKRISVEIVGDIKDRDGTIVKQGAVFKRTVFDPVTSKQIEQYEQDHGRFEIWKNLEVYNPKTGKAASEYFCSMGNLHVKNFKADGDTIKNSISIAGVRTENFEEAVKLFKKYASLSDDEILKLYKQKLENPADISMLEFKILQGNYDMRFDTEPLISDATVVSEHGAVNGYNTRVRYFVKGGMKDADEFKFLKPRINKIDKEFANLPPLEKDCVFYRGLADKYIPDVINGKVGDVVVPDEGYAYGAFHRELASRFAETMLVIRTPKGAKISRCGAHGGETLYPRGAEFKILSKNKGPDGKNIIELEYILPKS